MALHPNIHSDHEMASFPSDYTDGVVLYRNIHSNHGMVSFKSNYTDGVVLYRNIHSNHGMVSFKSDYIQHLKESYSERSYIGKAEYISTLILYAIRKPRMSTLTYIHLY
jgi:hypothetical protein